ncbi:hypothetical protein B0H17DRAFT_1156000 [Mycena rosella]|uniref:Protein kinase domain-containing protein n=1 Tax=Mycena rosella TaxID=1033263 RepID=A0AAD7H0G6_MYCRO|nr:hypothetical protein B0H17DRAFT_1156000 [Mycena rosella]
MALKSHSEIFWLNHQQWLQTCGYMLRPQFHPGWTPSWSKTKRPPSLAFYTRMFAPLIDAIRIADGAPVALKKINKSVPEYVVETEIGLYFSTPPRASHPQHHCIPIYEVLDVPDNNKEYGSPPFDMFGEAVEFFRQIFEGLRFMHSHHVAHRDCQSGNIMMDVTQLYPNGFHSEDVELNQSWKGKAKHTCMTCTKCNPKYYLIDFGLSRMHDPANKPPLEYPDCGGDRKMPQLQGQEYHQLHDPFPIDVYYIGNLIRREFIEFMQPLVTNMVAEHPTKRPIMDEVFVRFEEIRRSLSTWKLRSRPVPRNKLGIVNSLVRRIGYILRRIPPVPVLGK